MDAQETYKLQARKAEATEAAQQEVIARLRVELAVQEVSNAGTLEALQRRHGTELYLSLCAHLESRYFLQQL